MEPNINNNLNCICIIYPLVTQKNQRNNLKEHVVKC